MIAYFAFRKSEKMKMVLFAAGWPTTLTPLRGHHVSVLDSFHDLCSAYLLVTAWEGSKQLFEIKKNQKRRNTRLQSSTPSFF